MGKLTSKRATKDPSSLLSLKRELATAYRKISALERAKDEWKAARRREAALLNKLAETERTLERVTNQGTVLAENKCLIRDAFRTFLYAVDVGTYDAIGSIMPDGDRFRARAPRVLSIRNRQ